MSEENIVRIRLGKYHVRVPAGRFGRTVLGLFLCVGGLLGFLPVLGFWMLPLGLAVLSIDSPFVRHYWRKGYLWFGRKLQSWRAKA